MAESQRRFDQGSLDFARRLGPHIAASIDNARLYSRLSQALDDERLAVETLQRGLTPGPLPDLDGIVLADHYDIGGTDKVGGDWYDVLETGADQIALIIGDVVGRGVRAVGSMAQLRNALRALLIEGHSPSVALSLLHRLATADPNGGGFATVACLTYDRGGRKLAWSTAGHPPAMIRHPDGVVERLWQRPDSPLGVGGGEYSQNEASVPPDALLLLYTDGLIERRGEGLDVSLDRLETELASAPRGPKALVAHLVDRLPSQPSIDDVAVLAIHFE